MKKNLKTIFICIFVLLLESCGLMLSYESADGSKSAVISLTQPKAFVSQYAAGLLRTDAGEYSLRLTYDCVTDQLKTIQVRDGDKVVIRFKNGESLNLYAQSFNNAVRLDEYTARLFIQCPISLAQLQLFLQSPVYSVEWQNYFEYSELEIPLERSIKFAEIISEYAFGKKLSKDVLEKYFECEQHTILDESQWDY